MNDILRWLKHGRENAISLGDLQALTGMPRAAILAEIERIREQTAILTRGEGVYIVNSVDEALEYIDERVI